MNTKLLLLGSLRTLWRYRLRTFFMSLGVAAGVAIFLAARSLSVGAEQAMVDKVEKMFGATSILINVAGAPQGARPGPITSLRIADLEAIASRLDTIAAWDPMIITGGRRVSFEGEHRRVTVHGHSERAELAWNRGVIDGRFFTAADLASAAPVALVGTDLARELFAGSDPIGKQILIDSVPFTVEGVLEPIGIDPHGTNRDEDIHVPTTTVMRRLLEVDYITTAKLVVHDPATVEPTAAAIAEILRARHGLADGEPDDFAIFTPIFVQRMLERADRVLDIFMPLAAGSALLVAGLVISTLMLITVRERIAEIGLRRAVGATTRHIRAQILLETVAITSLAAFVGLGVGALAVFLIGQGMHLPMTLSPGAAVLGLVASILVGILSSLVPAHRAARLDPIEALR